MTIWLFTVAVLMWRFTGAAGNDIAEPPPNNQSSITASTFWIPATFVRTKFDQPVYQEEVGECEILGTKITGDSRCSGSVVSSIEGGQRHVDVRSVVKGVIESENMGMNGPAKIDSITSTTFTATKIVRFEGMRLTTWPVEVTVETNLTITNIDTHLKGTKGVLVKRIAFVRAEDTKEEVRAIAETITKKRLAEKIDGEFDRQLTRANLLIQLCRGPIVQIGKRDIQISTRGIENNLEVGIVLVTAEEDYR